ncbi:MAG: arylesterase [Methylobacteriaceae bacterium]|nr:arylesterase [Methylobacteriaceae bacterium]
MISTRSTDRRRLQGVVDLAWFRSRSDQSLWRELFAGGHRTHGVARRVLQFVCFVVLSVATNAAGAEPVRIVAFGDSLTAGYQLPAAEAFPNVLQARLRADGFSVAIANAGVSGDTAAGGLARLDWSVPDRTDLAIVELGANDMLRGAPPAEAARALAQVVERLQARNILVVLAGMRSIANWGEAYRAEFEAIYPDLAKRYGTPFYPFFLEGVAGDRALTQSDGMHPNKAGVVRIVAGFAPFLEGVLTERFGARARGSD